MFKVFIVDDEVIIREELRTSIPWEQCGFINVGDATDGEMALPMICAQQPDLVITDIKMPFMDGLELSRRITQQFPNIKIIILSGCDNFSYAQQAIQIGVEQYLLKPLNKAALIKALGKVREKLVREQEQRDYLAQFEQENQQQKKFAKRSFFENLIGGAKSVNWVYEEAERLNIPIAAQSYNLVLFTFYSDHDNEDWQSREAQELEHFFLRFSHFNLFRWSLTIYGVLVCEEDSRIESETRFCVDSIKRHFESAGEHFDWYIAAGTPTKRLSSLHSCFSQVSKILSYRYICVGQHELTSDSISSVIKPQTEIDLQGLDVAKISPEILSGFMKNGRPEEAEDFITQYVQGLGSEVMKSMLFCQYIMLNMRFACTGYINQMGIDTKELLSAVAHMPRLERLFGEENVKKYCIALVKRTLELREASRGQKYHEAVRLAMRYIEKHYADSTLSLNDVAAWVKISPNYFSTLFSQETGKTFVEYLTAKRMEQARRLLHQSSLRSSEIACAVGYKDPHYFSHLFRKTQGCTPREFRANGTLL